MFQVFKEQERKVDNMLPIVKHYELNENIDIISLINNHFYLKGHIFHHYFYINRDIICHITLILSDDNTLLFDDKLNINVIDRKSDIPYSPFYYSDDENDEHLKSVIYSYNANMNNLCEQGIFKPKTNENIKAK